ncbi:hypothetical protein HC891_00760 [Candidatus Gracilibacteria bacterium]|nr:hypothetical protein [Candidatus Gracilibacteria bacterium]
MGWLLPQLVTLAGVALTAALIIAWCSPFEALGWWAGWSGGLDDDVGALPRVVQPSTTRSYLVYLTGIGGFAPNEEGYSRRELSFFDGLSAQLPDVVLVHDVFPFSVSNNPLDGQRQLAGLWSWLHSRVRKPGGALLYNLVMTRNMMQVAVSSDRRYGPIYNYGVGREIAQSLVRHGYRPDSYTPVVLLGVSGGGQVALGAAPTVRALLGAPVTVISLAGVLSDDPGIDTIEHLYHLQGSRDRVPLLGALLFPGRWPWVGHSNWNRAQHDGRITLIDTGPMTHMGEHEYLARRAVLPNGQRHVDHTIELIEKIFVEEGLCARTQQSAVSSQQGGVLRCILPSLFHGTGLCQNGAFALTPTPLPSAGDGAGGGAKRALF